MNDTKLRHPPRILRPIAAKPRKGMSAFDFRKYMSSLHWLFGVRINIYGIITEI